MKHLVSGGPGEGDCSGTGLGGTGKVQQPQLTGHLLPFEPLFELLQEVHHVGVHLKVGEVVVDPKEHHTGHTVSQ